MLEIFDDGDSTRIRRSIFIVSFAIVAVDQYNATLVLPSFVRAPDSDEISIPPAEMVGALWWLNTYLICRHILTEVSLWLQSKAVEADKTGLSDRAERLDAHLVKIGTSLDAVSDSIGHFEEVQGMISRDQNGRLEEANGIAASLVDKEDRYRRLVGSGTARDALSRELEALSRELTHDIQKAKSSLSAVSASITSPMDRQKEFIDKHFDHEMINIAELTSFELKAEGRAVGGLGFDRFWFANGVVAAVWIYASISTGYGILNVVPLFVLLVCLHFLVDPLKRRIGK